MEGAKVVYEKLIQDSLLHNALGELDCVNTADQFIKRLFQSLLLSPTGYYALKTAKLLNRLLTAVYENQLSTDEVMAAEAEEEFDEAVDEEERLSKLEHRRLLSPAECHQVTSFFCALSRTFFATERGTEHFLELVYPTRPLPITHCEDVQFAKLKLLLGLLSFSNTRNNLKQQKRQSAMLVSRLFESFKTYHFSNRCVEQTLRIIVYLLIKTELSSNNLSEIPLSFYQLFDHPHLGIVDSALSIWLFSINDEQRLKLSGPQFVQDHRTGHNRFLLLQKVLTNVRSVRCWSGKCQNLKQPFEVDAQQQPMFLTSFKPWMNIAHGEDASRVACTAFGVAAASVYDVAFAREHRIIELTNNFLHHVPLHVESHCQSTARIKLVEDALKTDICKIAVRLGSVASDNVYVAARALRFLASLCFNSSSAAHTIEQAGGLTLAKEWLHHQPLLRQLTSSTMAIKCAVAACELFSNTAYLNEGRPLDIEDNGFLAVAEILSDMAKRDAPKMQEFHHRVLRAILCCLWPSTDVTDQCATRLITLVQAAPVKYVKTGLLILSKLRNPNLKDLWTAACFEYVKRSIEANMPATELSLDLRHELAIVQLRTDSTLTLLFSLLKTTSIFWGEKLYCQFSKIVCYIWLHTDTVSGLTDVGLRLLDHMATDGLKGPLALKSALDFQKRALTPNLPGELLVDLLPSDDYSELLHLDWSMRLEKLSKSHPQSFAHGRLARWYWRMHPDYHREVSYVLETSSQSSSLNTWSTIELNGAPRPPFYWRSIIPQLCKRPCQLLDSEIATLPGSGTTNRQLYFHGTQLRYLACFQKFGVRDFGISSRADFGCGFYVFNSAFAAMDWALTARMASSLSAAPLVDGVAILIFDLSDYRDSFPLGLDLSDNDNDWLALTKYYWTRQTKSPQLQTTSANIDKMSWISGPVSCPVDSISSSKMTYSGSVVQQIAFRPSTFKWCTSRLIGVMSFSVQ